MSYRQCHEKCNRGVNNIGCVGTGRHRFCQVSLVIEPFAEQHQQNDAHRRPAVPGNGENETGAHCRRLAGEPGRAVAATLFVPERNLLYARAHPAPEAAQLESRAHPKSASSTLRLHARLTFSNLTKNDIRGPNDYCTQL